MEDKIKNWKDEDWPVIQRQPNKAGRIPYGYMVNPENDMELIINEDEVRNLETAFEHLSNMSMSLREACDWLFLENKRELTHAGLNFLWKKRKGNEDTARKKRYEHLRYGVPKARQKEANYRRGRKIAGIKKSMAAKEKKLKELEEQKRVREETLGKAIESIKYDFETIPEEKEIVFKPNEGPQTEFLAATELQVLYGGAAGGEPKSWFSASFHSNVSK